MKPGYLVPRFCNVLWDKKLTPEYLWLSHWTPKMEEGSEEEDTGDVLIRLREECMQWLTTALAKKAEFISVQMGLKGGCWSG